MSTSQSRFAACTKVERTERRRVSMKTPRADRKTATRIVGWAARSRMAVMIAEIVELNEVACAEAMVAGDDGAPRMAEWLITVCVFTAAAVASPL